MRPHLKATKTKKRKTKQKQTKMNYGVSSEVEVLGLVRSATNKEKYIFLKIL
jgi:hypothetical protein